MNIDSNYGVKPYLYNLQIIAIPIIIISLLQQYLLHASFDVEQSHEGEADGELRDAVRQHVRSVAHFYTEFLHQRNVDMIISANTGKKKVFFVLIRV